MKKAPPSRSGLATKKFAGSPAAAAFVRNVALPSRSPASPFGFGLCIVKRARLAVFVHCVPEYGVPVPLKNATNVGSVADPGIPGLNANEHGLLAAPQPAATCSCRLRCAFLNSARKLFSTSVRSL